jgi:hypothetical protein
MAIEVPGEFGFLLGLATVIVESIIVVLLYRTVKDYAEVAKVSRIEAKHRFRPWVGPAGGIDFLRVANAKNQYAIAIKNFGEIPASSVVGMSGARTDLPSREAINKDELGKFNLGPLLPYMEKRYWIFVDTEMIEKAKHANNPIYVIVYFLYEFPSGGKSGYGMISQLDQYSNTFIHRDMWVDQEVH